jgi:hypothetical protein
MNAIALKINIRRVFLGGVVAGLVIFAINGVVNGAILSGQFQVWAQGMGQHLRPPTFPVALGLWLVMSWLLGTAGVWIAAEIVARGHTRMPAALRAGMLVWIIGKGAVGLDFIALGLIPPSLVMGQLICGLVAILVGVCCGAALYRK